MKKWLVVVLMVMFVLVASGPSYAASKVKITTETFFIDATDAGIKLHVRNKYLSGKRPFHLRR